MKNDHFKQNLKALRREYDIVRELHDFCQTSATDHSRLFKRKHGGIVLVCSNYPDNAPGLLESQGFAVCPPIYTNETTTYYKTFSSRRELNKLLMTLDELRHEKAACVLAGTQSGRKQKTYMYSNAEKCNFKSLGRRSYSGKRRI